MLEPDGRVVLLDQLRPPVGHQLEAAVATTFTMHLGTALVPPLAFASHELRTRPDPIAALQAVRSCADRVDIFCQAGQIAVPGQASDLMAFLEPMVHPVRRPRPGFLFHPKVWFLRYSAPDLPDAYRLLCSTRNLVDSHAWDAVVSLDGVVEDKPLPVNKPLAAFLRQLPGWAVTPLHVERRARILDLADRASRVRWTLPERVSEVRFHAFGVPRLIPSPDFSGYRHLVVSPFCNEAGIKRVMAGNTTDVAIVSQSEDLAALDPQFLARLRRPGGDAVFVLDPLAGLGSPADSEGGGEQPALGVESELTGLHAKITIAERNRGDTHVFVGSANATSVAYEGNVEFLVELVGRSTQLGIGTLMNPGDGKNPTFRDLLQPYRASDGVSPPEDEARRRLENVLRNLAAVPSWIRVEPGEGGYLLRLTSDAALSVPPGHTVSLGLLTRPGVSHTRTASAPWDVSFAGVPLPDVTPFVTLRVTDGSGLTLGTVIHAPLENDPPGRLDEVLARQVNTREKFLRFLALLLGLGDSAALWAAGSGPDDEPSDWGARLGGSTGVFELVLGALADRQQSLVDLDGLVSRLRATDVGRQILPEGFDGFWMAVTSTMTALKERV